MFNVVINCDLIFMTWNLFIKHFTYLGNANVKTEPTAALSKAPYTLSVKLSDYTV